MVEHYLPLDTRQDDPTPPTLSIANVAGHAFRGRGTVTDIEIGGLAAVARHPTRTGGGTISASKKLRAFSIVLMCVVLLLQLLLAILLGLFVSSTSQVKKIEEVLLR